MKRLLGLVFVIMLGMFVLTRVIVPTAAADGEAAADPAGSGGAGAAEADREDTASSLDEITIARDSSGQFHLSAVVNGADTPFLVDTGADMVAITVASAEDMGIEVDRESFRPVARTASGVGYGVPVQLDRFEVGGRELNNVDAVVMDGLSVNLLGQSALGQLGSIELRGDAMVIRPD